MVIYDKNETYVKETYVEKWTKTNVPKLVNDRR